MAITSPFFSASPLPLLMPPTPWTPSLLRLLLSCTAHTRHRLRPSTLARQGSRSHTDDGSLVGLGDLSSIEPRSIEGVMRQVRRVISYV